MSPAARDSDTGWLTDHQLINVRRCRLRRWHPRAGASTTDSSRPRRAGVRGRLLGGPAQPELS